METPPVLLIALSSVVMEDVTLVKTVMMVLVTPTLFLMLADSTARAQPVVMVSETILRTVTVDPTPPDNARTAELSVEMEFWMLVKSVMMVFTTATLFPMLAEPAADCGLVVMESLTCWKNVMLVLPMPTNLMLADLGAAFPNVVMALLMLDEVKLAMMAINWMVMVVTVAATRNVEMAELILVRCVMMDHATATPNLPAAD